MAFADTVESLLHPAVFDTFGEPASVNDTVLTGIFTAAHEGVDVSTGVPVSTVQPVLEVRKQDLANGVEQGDPVTVRGLGYVVVDVRPDGHGTMKLFLHRADYGD